MIYQLSKNRPAQNWVGLFFVLISLNCVAQSSITLSQGTQLSISVVPTEVTQPWEIVPITNDLVWVTERTLGQVSEVNLVTGAKRTILTIPTDDFVPLCCVGVTGILGMVLHPDYDEGTQEVFISYTNSNFSQTLVKYEYNGTLLVNPEVLLDPGESADNHGSRLLVAHDRTMLMSIGSGDELIKLIK